MSTLQNFFFQRNPEKYWKPIELATSPVLNKTSSSENLSLEEKLTKLENSVQELKQNCYEIDKSREIFFTRILRILQELEGEDSVYLREFYEESPHYVENNDFLSMINTLAWLSYSDKLKKKLLDKDLNNYFLS